MLNNGSLLGSNEASEPAGNLSVIVQSSAQAFDLALLIVRTESVVLVF